MTGRPGSKKGGMAGVMAVPKGTPSYDIVGQEDDNEETEKDNEENQEDMEEEDEEEEQVTNKTARRASSDDDRGFYRDCDHDSLDGMRDVEVTVDPSIYVQAQAYARYRDRRKQIVRLCVATTICAAAGGGAVAIVLLVPRFAGGNGGGGRVFLPWSAGSLAPVPPNLSSICSPVATSTQKGHDMCMKACAPAECCFLPSSHVLSCLTGNEDQCASYENICDVLDVSIPPAPHNLVHFCSPGSLATKRGKSRCSDLCGAALCCLEPIESCRALNPENCQGYKACYAFYGEEDEDQYDASLFLPPPNPRLEDICSDKAVASVDGFRMCSDACRGALCCSEPVDSCRVLNPKVCGEYSPCSELYGMDVDTWESSIEVPHPPPNLGHLCSKENIQTIEGFAKCEGACENSRCCRLGPELCRVLNPDVCPNYGVCDILFKKDRDKFQGNVEVPAISTDIDMIEVCSAESVGTVEGFTQCESICDRGRCCE